MWGTGPTTELPGNFITAARQRDRFIAGVSKGSRTPGRPCLGGMVCLPGIGAPQGSAQAGGCCLGCFRRHRASGCPCSLSAWVELSSQVPLVGSPGDPWVNPGGDLRVTQALLPGPEGAPL